MVPTGKPVVTAVGGLEAGRRQAGDRHGLVGEDVPAGRIRRRGERILIGDRGSASIMTAVLSVVGSAGTVIAAGSKYRHASAGGAATVSQSAG